MMSASLLTALTHRARQLAATGQQGAVTLEATIVSAALLLFFAVFLQASMLFTSNNLAHQAATIGYNTARLYDADTGGAQAAAYNLALNGAGHLEDVHVSVTRGGQDATVTVTGVSPSFVPGLATHVSQTVTGPIERVTP